LSRERSALHPLPAVYVREEEMRDVRVVDAAEEPSVIGKIVLKRVPIGNDVQQYPSYALPCRRGDTEIRCCSEPLGNYCDRVANTLELGIDGRRFFVRGFAVCGPWSVDAPTADFSSALILSVFASTA
jgi:hypothetical protein